MATERPSVKKCVLAYSGGLDTSVFIPWLKENYGCEVVAFSADLGQGDELGPIKAKAVKTGAVKAVVKDLRKEFIDDFAFPALRAGAIYEGKYPLATALGRPLIAKWLVDVARKEGGDAIAHGCTGKGNDQVRFEVVTNCLAPELISLAPVREWELKTREQEIEYAKKHKVPVSATLAKPYSIDANLWGTSIECGVLEDPWASPPEDAWPETRNPEKCSTKGVVVEIGFSKGVPVSINGKRMNSVKLVGELKKLGERHGIGRMDMVENRLVGIKSREIYEAPAAVILHTAHRELEAMTLDRQTANFKARLAPEYAALVYDGLWFSPLREALQAFIDKTQETVTGSIKLKLRQGAITVLGRKSRYSLYDLKLATYEAGDTFDHKAAEGFIGIFGLPYKVVSKVRGRK